MKTLPLVVFLLVFEFVIAHYTRRRTRVCSLYKKTNMCLLTIQEDDKHMFAHCCLVVFAIVCSLKQSLSLMMPMFITLSGWSRSLLLIDMDVMLLIFGICLVVRSWCAVPLTLLVTDSIL